MPKLTAEELARANRKPEGTFESRFLAKCQAEAINTIHRNRLTNDLKSEIEKFLYAPEIEHVKGLKTKQISDLLESESEKNHLEAYWKIGSLIVAAATKGVSRGVTCYDVKKSARFPGSPLWRPSNQVIYWSHLLTHLC